MFQRDWFEAGSAVFEGLTDDPASLPPLSDMQAQRAWLAGFLASWSEWLDRQGFPLSDERESATLDDRLNQTLRDRPELLRQLRSYRLGSQDGLSTEPEMQIATLTALGVLMVLWGARAKQVLTTISRLH